MQRRVLKGESGPVCLASLADQLTSRNSARRWASISPNIDQARRVVIGYRSIVVCLDCGTAEFAVLPLRPNCANSQRETRRQVNLEIESYLLTENNFG